MSSTTQVATFGGGCFWCIDAAFRRVNGVSDVSSGYTGGNTDNPTYKSVCSGTTGHAEVVKVEFDSTIVSFETLLAMFFTLHDATFQHTGLAVVLQGLVRPRLRGTELEFWRNSEEARTDRPSQQLRSLNGEWRLMRYFLLTHLCGISHRIWCTLSTICSDAA
jgi:Peptide methionine sulfoxide reductase